MKKTSEAQLRATKKWQEANKDRARYNRYKSDAKRFILKIASIEDVKFLSQQIQIRLDEEAKD
ncbi:hypothetical protein [Listeria sp. ILCC797]|uniref:hypothetical protein n=1 Tax=Listeria sp. ILCC797 TaxID=1918333 RepID=UPI000B589C81|nr:hypothetical protein [Listeria sp. ILCC797]